MLLVNWLVISLVIIVPVWRIFRRAGLNPALSLFFFIPGIGWLVVYLMLALMRWPATESGEGAARP